MAHGRRIVFSGTFRSEEFPDFFYLQGHVTLVVGRNFDVIKTGFPAGNRKAAFEGMGNCAIQLAIFDWKVLSRQT